MKTVKHEIFSIAVAVAIVSLLFKVSVDYLELPMVYTDAITNECVKVIHYDGTEGSCGSLPDKYHHQYVHKVDVEHAG